jgi:hypothetical protein
MWPLALVLGAGAGLGLLLAVRELVPSQPRLGATIARLAGLDKPADVELRKGEVFGKYQKAGSWVGRHLPNALSALGRPSDADLDLINKSRTALLGEKALSAVAGLFLPLVAAVLGRLLGLGVPVAPPLIASVACAVGTWFLPDVSVRQAAATARAEFSRAAAIYLELLAIERNSASGTAQSAMGAAQVAHSWPFQRITEALERARMDGTSAWTALRDLGTELGVPELVDIAGILEQAGTRGSAVFEQLQGKAKSLREVQLAVVVQRARAATGHMWYVVPFTGVIYFVMLTYPMAVTLLFPG